jgi:uncharacterized protein (DUF2235 family)
MHDAMQKVMHEAASAPPRRIVVCLDGTNNEPGKARTNVQRIYSMIARIPDRQITYYQPGVGTIEPIGVASRLWVWVLKAADSVSGWMVPRHVCSAYAFLCETYRPGDEIYLFGFSRGAQSARVLAGMLATVGLLHPGMREMIPFAWKAYTKWAPFTAAGAIGRFFWGARDGRKKRDYHRRAGDFMESFGRPVRIRFMGVWDTVAAIGMPWSPQIFHRSDSNADIDIVRHALAIDERRMTFEPTLLVPHADQDFEEWWFPGVHSEVGGGYGGDAAGDMAKISLGWMIDEAKATGLIFDETAVAKSKLPNRANHKALGKAASGSHRDELRKLHWKCIEFLPIPRWWRNDNGWRLRIWPHGFGRRQVPLGANVHISAYLRQERDAAYRMPNVPAEVVKVE